MATATRSFVRERSGKLRGHIGPCRRRRRTLTEVFKCSGLAGLILPQADEIAGGVAEGGDPEIAVGADGGDDFAAEGGDEGKEVVEAVDVEIGDEGAVGGEGGRLGETTDEVGGGVLEFGTFW
jgi:hypothetical protein